MFVPAVDGDHRRHLALGRAAGDGQPRLHAEGRRRRRRVDAADAGARTGAARRAAVPRRVPEPRVRPAGRARPRRRPRRGRVLRRARGADRALDVRGSLRDQPTVQAARGSASKRGSGRPGRGCRETVGDVWDTIVAGDPPAMGQRVLLRLAITSAITTSAEGRRRPAQCRGAAALDEDHPLQQRLQDARAAAAHIQAAPIVLEVTGALLLGAATAPHPLVCTRLNERHFGQTMHRSAVRWIRRDEFRRAAGLPLRPTLIRTDGAHA